MVLLTPDDVAYLRSVYASGDDDPEATTLVRIRPDVLFEAGMAMNRDLRRTVLVELGQLRHGWDVPWLRSRQALLSVCGRGW